MFLNHNNDQVLATSRNFTLSLTEDDRGLLVEAELPDTSYGRDLSVLIQRGDVHSMSFGFSVPSGGESRSADGQSRRLNEVILHEVSVVTFPAYPQTSASVRAVDMLADKTGEDASALNAALSRLEAGETLTADQAGLLSTVVATLSPAPEPEPQPVEETAPSASLDLLRAQLDLALKAI